MSSIMSQEFLNRRAIVICSKKRIGGGVGDFFFRDFCKGCERVRLGLGCAHDVLD
jgi:hypothetical protein